MPNTFFVGGVNVTGAESNWRGRADNNEAPLGYVDGEVYVAGITDDAHVRVHTADELNATRAVIDGNSGTAAVGGNNGYAFGVAPTPVVAAPSAGGTLTSGVTVSVFVVAITPLGYPNNSQYGYQAAPTVVSVGILEPFTARIGSILKRGSDILHTCFVHVPGPARCLETIGIFMQRHLVNMSRTISVEGQRG